MHLSGGHCPEGFFWRAIVKEHLAEGFCLGEQVEPNPSSHQKIGKTEAARHYMYILTCPKGFGLKLAKLGLKTPLKK